MGQPTAVQTREATFDLLSLDVGQTATIEAFKGVLWHVTRLAGTHTKGGTLIGVSIMTTSSTARIMDIHPSDVQIGRHVTKSRDVRLGRLGKIEAVKSVKVGSRLIFD